jgi:phosphatidate cytidylyltransferase
MKNLFTRTVSGIVFMGIMVGCLLGGVIPYACLMLFLLIGMLSEFYELTMGKGFWLQKTIGTLAGVTLWMAVLLLLTSQYGTIALALFLVLFLLWIFLFMQQLYKKSDTPFADIACTLLGFMYVALPLALMNLMVFNFGGYGCEYDGTLLLALFIILWGNDVGAYVFGMLFGQKGKHKLFPSISPKKSWEGFAGGLLIALLTGYVLHLAHLLSFGWTHSLVISLLIAVFGVFGDLIESMLKRSAGVKDSGKIMPGHGGLLDRFDAALLAFPVACIYIAVIKFYLALI